MEQESLKPCPFCGCEAKAWEYEDEQDVFDPISLGWVDTRCVTWHCVGCESCEIVISRLSKDDAIAAWNARAAVTDEQFAVAVHDGQVWQAARECRNVGEETCDDFKCSLCGASYNESDDMAMPASLIDWCFSCGAKVKGAGE